MEIYDGSIMVIVPSFSDLVRIGFALGNEFFDHVMESKNYLLSRIHSYLIHFISDGVPTIPGAIHIDVTRILSF